MDFLAAAAGLLILVFAGDALVRGAVALALRFGIPSLVVSLTIVAFGTSAPELLISVDAILKGAPALALGNVVGSNTANVLLVLGVPALISRLATSEHDTRKSYLQMLAVTLGFIAVSFAGPLTWLHGIAFLAVLAVILWGQAREALAHRRGRGEGLEGAEAARRMPGWRVGLLLVVGLVGLPLGAEILVGAALSIAREFGVSEGAIGLTLVAVGTSLPELATTVMAAFRRQADVALGNVIGSNMFNLLAILGISTLVGPIPVDRQFLVADYWVMLAATLIVAPFVFSKARDLTRRWGTLFVALYAAYAVWVIS